ncbi:MULTISPECIES: hypothetical protein [unclassified Saccharibacter]|uniref:hypothetical protein n=1 Tax=unclassified Saccharibacter TaxID=2648722 RepID=UPI00132193A2|nr:MULTISPECIES: hypothetical protein [unclassified Saccharibacter]MXV35998.1 hypothetical protein [Saccharibacter sp. EH611]MXV56857.1 hypothetical protein [Saccharibacter sp. EH70]MXV66783.1 hypothetical protein [Saccharibacter sp. EH60]
MSDDKNAEGFIPQGLVAGDLHGTAAGSLTIAGVVERSDIKTEQLVVAETGRMTDGVAEAETIIIEGQASQMTFRAGRLSAGASARISDCMIEMSNPTGCAIDENAHFEGDVKIAVVRSQGASRSTPSASAPSEKKEREEQDSSSSSKSFSSGGSSEHEKTSHDNGSSGSTHGSGGTSYGSASHEASAKGGYDIDDAAEVEIPLGD